MTMPLTTMTTTKGQRTASRILDVAEELFARQGFAVTSLRDIAQAAGIQQPGLYKYFSGKEELFRSVYERAVKPLVGILDETLAQPGDAHSFRMLTDRMIDEVARRPNVAKLLVRATLLPPEEPDEVAMGWLRQLVRRGKQINQQAGIKSDDDLLSLQIVSVYNLLFGYFASASMTEALTGKPAIAAELVARHKMLVARFVSSL